MKLLTILKEIKIINNTIEDLYHLLLKNNNYENPKEYIRLMPTNKGSRIITIGRDIIQPTIIVQKKDNKFILFDRISSSVIASANSPQEMLKILHRWM